jgi:FkbM family methyltransferase
VTSGASDADVSVAAVHRDWRGILRLSPRDGSVVHEGPGSKGRYELSDGVLAVYWEKFPPEVFVEVAGSYIAQSLLRLAPGLEKMNAVTIGGKLLLPTRVHVRLPNAGYEVGLRLHTSDVPTFAQIFINDEYDSPSLPATANTIVDLGANIGLSAIFFGLRYPKARILCVEPDGGNFYAMASNVAALGDRVYKVQGAVWTRDGVVSLRTEDTHGQSLGAWGVQVGETASAPGHRVTCYTLETVLRMAMFDKVDILKVDIEGAEREIFSCNMERWLPRVNMVIMETHDRFHPGSEETVRAALGSLFRELPRCGENLVFLRLAP